MITTGFATVFLLSALAPAEIPPVTSVAGPSDWANVWGVAYHDDYDMLYIGGPPNGSVAYGIYTGGEIVTWTVFDTVESICGLACYQDDVLYAITQMDPFNPGPFYLYTWQLDSSGIPQLPADIHELGDPFIGTFGGCEWDGTNLWILDQNVVFDDNATIYRYDVNTHSVLNSFDYSELGGVGIACVLDTGDLGIWVSDWYGGYKIVEHTENGIQTGRSYSITTNSTDMAYKYGTSFHGSGFFVGNHSASVIDFYSHNLSSLARGTWGGIKSTFRN